jgi:hypothetical protein
MSIGFVDLLDDFNNLEEYSTNKNYWNGLTVGCIVYRRNTT